MTISQKRIADKRFKVELLFEHLEETEKANYATINAASGLTTNEISFLIKSGFIKKIGGMKKGRYKITDPKFEPIHARRMIEHSGDMWRQFIERKTGVKVTKRTEQNNEPPEINFETATEYTVKKYDYKPKSDELIRNEKSTPLDDNLFVKYCTEILDTDPARLTIKQFHGIRESEKYKLYLWENAARTLAENVGFKTNNSEQIEWDELLNYTRNELNIKAGLSRAQLLEIKETAGFKLYRINKLSDSLENPDEMLSDNEKRAYNDMPEEITVNDSAFCFDKIPFLITVVITLVILSFILGSL